MGRRNRQRWSAAVLAVCVCLSTTLAMTSAGIHGVVTASRSAAGSMSVEKPSFQLIGLALVNQRTMFGEFGAKLRFSPSANRLPAAVLFFHGELFDSAKCVLPTHVLPLSLLNSDVRLQA